ncbi:phage tail tip lysozyme [Aureimonas sp. AU12]|uniref:phage tail tip lysozyme n=1 Tax=Aureimonas sp. AU12 TaxID=1638161 RepID=UPI000780DFAA|nr:phage tail tip lysozyme [Aureimonas sp. AU12]
MAATEQRIDELVFRAKTEGIDQAKAALGGLQAAHAGAGQAAGENARVHEEVGRAMRNPTAAFDDLRRKLEGSPAAWKALERGLRVVSRAADEGKSEIAALDQTVDDLLRNFQRAVAPKLSPSVDLTPLKAMIGETKRFDDQARAMARTFLKNAEDAEQALRLQAKAAEDLATRTAKFRAELDPLSAAQARLNAQLAEAASLRDAGAIGDDEVIQRTRQLNKEFDDQARRLGVANDNLKLTSGQVQGLGYQINDVGTMLAMGASPFQVIASQAGQVVQVLQEGGGVKASLAAIGATSIATARTILAAMGPVGMAFTGITIAAGAFALAMRKDIPDASATLEKHERILGQISDRYEGLADKVRQFGQNAASTLGVQAGAVGRDLATVLAEQRKQAERAFVGGSDYTGFAMFGTDDSSQIPSLPKFEPIRAQVEAFRKSLRDGNPDIDGFRKSLSAAYALAGNNEPMRKAIEAAFQFTDSLSATEAAIEANKAALQALNPEFTRLIERTKAFQDAMGELRTLGPDVGTAADRIQAAFDEASSSAQSYGQIVAAANAANAASAELARPSIEALQEAQDRLANLKLSPNERAIAEIKQQSDAKIAELQRVNGSEAAIAAERQRRDAEVAGVALEASRAETARRAGYELDVRAITARTSVEKAAIEAERVRIDLIAQGVSASEASARAEETRALAMVQSTNALSEALRQRTEAGQAQVDQAQFELTLVGQSAAETARLTAEYQMLATAKEAARAAGEVVSDSEVAAIKAQAAAIGEATGALQRLNFERDIAFDRQQASRSPEEQEIAERLRSMGVEYESAQGKADAAQLRLNKRLHETNDLIAGMRDDGKDAFLDLVDAIGSGEDALSAFAGAFAGLGKQLASLATDKIFDRLFGGVGDTGSTTNVGGILANVGTSIPSYSAGSLGETNSAPLGRVDRAPLPPLVTGEGFSASKAASVAGQSVPARVWNFFASKGLAAHQIAGIMGNGKAESAWNPAAIGDGGAALGLFQWNDRGPAMQRHVGADWRSDVDGQLDFAWKELQTSESRAYRALLKATDVTQATEAFLGFERPHGYNTGVRNSHNYSGRVANANEAYREFGGQNVASSTSDAQLQARAVSSGIVDANRKMAGGSDPWGGMRTATVAPTAATGIRVGTDGRPTGWNGMSNPGSVLGIQYPGFTAMGGVSAGLGGFGAGYQSGSPISGGLQGALGGFMAGGPIGGLIGLAGGALGGILGGRAKRKAAHEEAAKKWEEVRPQYEAFDRSLSGEGTGDLRAQNEDLWGKLNSFMQVGGAAWKNGTGNSSAQFAETWRKAAEKIFASYEEFREGFRPMLEDLTSGEGLQGTFAKGRAGAKALGEQVKNFIDDVKIAWGSADNGLPSGAPGDAADKEWKASREAAVAEAKAAAGAYALTMLYTADTTSDVQKAIDSFRGTAAGLQPILEQLGWSADDAAKAIDERLTQALTKMRGDFEEGISDQVNDLDGKGYLAEVREMLEVFEQTKKDAELLGADTSLLPKLFELQGQAIVDGAELTGDAFDELIKAFPVLAGVVEAFVEGAVKRTASQLKDVITGYGDRTFAATNDASALAGQLAIFDRQAQKEREAETAAGGKAMAELERALAAERLKIVRDSGRQIAMTAYDASKAQLQSLYDGLDSFSTSLKEFLSGMKIGDSSTLSAKDRLAESKRIYEETLSKANGGDAEARDRLLGVTQTYLDNAKGYFVSSEGYGKIFDEVQASLKATDVKTTSQLDLMRSQASWLSKINDSTLSVADALKDYLAAQTTLNAARNWGDPGFENRNKAIVGDLSNAGISYTGDFGGGKFLDWTNAQLPSQQAIINAIVDRYDRQFQLNGYDPKYKGTALYKGMQLGGIVGAYQGGGTVGNGVWNVDSVRARFAGGGDIALAGGEGVLTAPAMRMPGVSAFMEMANRGVAPRVVDVRRQAANSMGGSSYASRAEMTALGAKLDRLIDVTSGGFEGSIAATDRVGFATEQSAAASRRAASKSVQRAA